MRRTTVLALPIDEASAKIRTGPPIDDAEDLEHGSWGGVLPLVVEPGPPRPDEHCGPLSPPVSVTGYRRG